MIRITTLEQLAEALADGLRLEDPSQKDRGLSETEALELLEAGAEIIILGGPELTREVPRKHGRSGALNDLAFFGALVAPILPHLDRPGWALEVVDPLPINPDRPLYAFRGTPDATRPGEFIDFKTTFDSPKCAGYSTARGSDRRDVARKQIEGRAIRYPTDRRQPSVFDAGVNVQHHAIERNGFAIRLAIIPPSRLA